MIKKTVADVKKQVNKVSAHALQVLPDIIKNMGNDEEILCVFDGSIIEKNPGKSNKESATNTINILTNKKFYFAGTDGKSSIFLTMPKSGSVNLKDVHATNFGKAIYGEYIGFETKNDDYKIVLVAGTKSSPIKSALDKAIEEAQSVAEKIVTVQASLSSADEIKKFKELLDMGIISQEEFDEKKKQLLGI